MNFSLAGKVALVTGAARDVGGEISRTLAALGATVAINYNSSADKAEALVREIEVAGGAAKTYRADVADYDAVKVMAAAVAADFGTIDILVNNAGVAERERFLDTGPADWKRHIDVGLYEAIHTIHAVAPYMIAANKGGRTFRWRGFLPYRRGEPGPRRRGTCRNDRTDEIAGQGIRPFRHHRQRTDLGPDPDSAFLAGVAGGEPAENSAELSVEADRQAVRRGPVGRVPGVRGRALRSPAR